MNGPSDVVASVPLPSCGWSVLSMMVIADPLPEPGPPVLPTLGLSRVQVAEDRTAAPP